MQSLFKKQETQASFDQNGFVKVALLSEKQADELFSFFEETKQKHATVSDLHHTTTDTGNENLIRTVDETVKSVFVPELEKVMTDFKPLAATFHIKESGKGSETGIHQDPTFVDETRFYSVNVWVALHDITAENGNLYFVAGSHRAVHSIRSIPEHPSYYESFRDKLPGLATSVPLKKGEAVVFSNATIHGATENLSGKVRLAATLLLCSQPADWLLYYNDKQTPGRLDKYTLDMDTFMAVGRGQRPKSEPLSIPSDDAFPQLTLEDFLKKTGRSQSRLERFKNIFRRKAAV